MTFPRNNFPNYSYGAILTVPLGKTGRAQQLQGGQGLQGAGRRPSINWSEQNVLIQIQNTIEKAKSDFEQTKATRDARDYAEQALQAEQKKLEVGTSTSFIVLQLQSNLTDRPLRGNPGAGRLQRGFVANCRNLRGPSWRSTI